MRRVVIAIGLFAAVLTGCTAGASDETCGTIADDGIELLQEFVDEVDAMSPNELAAAAGDDAFILDLEDRANELDEEAAAAGCSESQMSSLLSVRADELSASTEFGQAIVDLIGEDNFFNNE